MSALARELRDLAATYWRDADKLPDPEAHRMQASAWHAAALMLEAGAIDAVDDCTDVYADDDVDLDAILTDLDLNNDCSDAGGHVWLASSRRWFWCGEHNVRCIHCGKPGMPVKGTREAE